MKQGSGSNVTSPKREPIVHGISPGGAAQIGTVVIVNPTPLEEGRGFTAPAPVAHDIYTHGSQGEHK